MNLLLFLMVCIPLTLWIYLILKIFLLNRRFISRLQPYINARENREKPSKRRLKVRTFLNVLSSRMVRVRGFEKYRKNVQFELLKAHLLLKSEEFIFIRLALVLAGAFTGYVLSRFFLGAMVLAWCGWYVPGGIVKMRIHKRVKEIDNQLGDVIVLISSSLKAGYSFFQAIDMVARQMPGPLGEEFIRIQKEINLGYTTEEALKNLTQRVKSADIDLLVTAILIQKQTGGNLTEILDNIAETIRDRVEIKGEIRTLTAQGRLSGTIISLLPPLLGLVLSVLNPGHMKVLFTDPLGMLVIVISAVMELLGIYAISRIVRIEV